jgi:hypothetical protein
LTIGPLNQTLTHNASKGTGKGGPHLVLLVWWKEVDDSSDCFLRINRV